MTSIGRGWTRRQSMIRPRRSVAVASSMPPGISSGATPTRWFATRSAVRSNQNRLSPVRTRPLSGIGVGRTTSKALSRSDATRSRRSSLTAYRSRTLPERMNEPASALASDMDLGLQAVESGDDGGDVAKVGGVVEAVVQVGEAHPLRNLRVDAQELAQRT